MPDVERAVSAERAAARAAHLGESAGEAAHMAHDVGDTMGLLPSHGFLPEPEAPTVPISSDAEMRPMPGYTADELQRRGYAEHFDPRTGTLHRYRVAPAYEETPDFVHSAEALGRGMAPGFDYPVAAGHYAANRIRAALGDDRYEGIPFAQVLAEVRAEHDQAAEENRGTEAIGSLALARAVPWSEASGLVGTGLRTAQAVGLDVAHQAGRGVDPVRATREAVSDAPLTAGLDASAPWVGHFLGHVIPAGPFARPKIRAVIQPTPRR